MRYIICAPLANCIGYSSIGGRYGALLYWWDVWGIALLVGCMGYCSIGGLFRVYTVYYIGWLYRA